MGGCQSRHDRLIKHSVGGERKKKQPKNIRTSNAAIIRLRQSSGSVDKYKRDVKQPKQGVSLLKNVARHRGLKTNHLSSPLRTSSPC